MTRRDRLKQLLDDIASGMIIGISVALDWQRRSLKINGAEFGHLLKADSHWPFLAALALRRPRKIGLVDVEDAVVPATKPINGIKPSNLRRELGRSLPAGVAALIIHAVSGKGYRLAPHVRANGGGEVSLRYGEECDKRVDEKSLPGKHSSLNDEEAVDDLDEVFDAEEEDEDTNDDDGEDDREDELIFK